ncbi:MAG: HD domain-containing protein, partial [Lachnospiraceae bacterium]|nr:HD domain-containing protein [Lachnospiraceae bacterium]
MNWNDLLSEKRFVEQINEDCTPYRNDYDTIICSTLFRRLQDKAQVFPLDDDDYVRTRLTHSLEVSAIGKKLGECAFAKVKAAGLDPWFEEHLEKEFSDVLLCAGLIHDIGNPPFGHFGEFAIREWFQKHL